MNLQKCDLSCTYGRARKCNWTRARRFDATTRTFARRRLRFDATTFARQRFEFDATTFLI